MTAWEVLNLQDTHSRITNDDRTYVTYYTWMGYAHGLGIEPGDGSWHHRPVESGDPRTAARRVPDVPVSVMVVGGGLRSMYLHGLGIMLVFCLMNQRFEIWRLEYVH